MLRLAAHSTTLLSLLVGWFLVITWPSKVGSMGSCEGVHGYSSTHLAFCLETSEAEKSSAKGVFLPVDDSNIVLVLVLARHQLIQ